MSSEVEHRERHLDLWLALLAGDRAWRDGAEEPLTREQAVGALMLAALAMTLLTQWVALAGRVDITDGVSTTERALLLCATASLVAAAALAVRPLALAAGRDAQQMSFGRSVAYRGLAYVVLIACTSGFLVRWRFLGAVPLGFVAGADSLLALWALGIAPRPLTWLRRFLFSTVHFGVLGAMLGTAMLEPDRGATLLSLYFAMWLGLAVALFTLTVMDHLNEIVDRQRELDRDAIREQERDHRAHWLHDDVLSEVRVATLRVGDHPEAEQARRELLDLDHRLRLRQLDEMIRGGSAYIYEVLQPHLRRAQALGVQLARVPSLETTGRLIDEESSRLVNRAISVVTSNAINAGATRLTIDLTQEDATTMQLTVMDDAGGFDSSTTPAGRGLDQLRRDLGPDAVEIVPLTGGSSVSVRFTVPIDGGVVDVNGRATLQDRRR